MKLDILGTNWLDHAMSNLPQNQDDIKCIEFQYFQILVIYFVLLQIGEVTYCWLKANGRWGGLNKAYISLCKYSHAITASVTLTLVWSLWPWNIRKGHWLVSVIQFFMNCFDFFHIAFRFSQGHNLGWGWLWPKWPWKLGQGD